MIVLEHLHPQNGEHELKSEDDAEDIADRRQRADDGRHDPTHSRVAGDETQRAQYAEYAQRPQWCENREDFGEEDEVGDDDDAEVEHIPRLTEVWSHRYTFKYANIFSWNHKYVSNGSQIMVAEVSLLGEARLPPCQPCQRQIPKTPP